VLWKWEIKNFHDIYTHETHRFYTENLERIVHFVFNLQLRYSVADKSEEGPAGNQEIRSMTMVKHEITIYAYFAYRLLNKNTPLSSALIALRCLAHWEQLHPSAIFDSTRATSKNKFTKNGVGTNQIFQILKTM